MPLGVGQPAWVRLRLSPQQYQELCVGRTDSFGLCRTQIMHVLEIMPYGSTKALLGHKGYIVPSSCWILVARHLVFPPRNPFHLCRVEVIRTSPGDTKA